MNKAILLVAALLASSVTALADFSFLETTNLTGGSMTGAMKFAGKFGGNVFNNMQTRVYISGDLMARVSDRTGSIINLKDQTITTIDYMRGEYSVITFEEMKQAQAEARAKVAKKKKKGDSDIQMKFSVDVKDPGRSAVIGGVNAKEMILLITAESVDKKNDSGMMNLATNMWLSKDIAGYDELQKFYRRMSESLTWNPSEAMLARIQQELEMGDSMAKLQEQASKLEGAKVKQVLRLGGSPDGLERVSQEDQEKVAAAQENGGGSGLLKGALGGFGGFGRKKNRDAEPQSDGTSTSDQAGVIMELTTLSSEFSNAAVSADKFQPDPAFKKVESKMLK